MSSNLNNNNVRRYPSLTEKDPVSVSSQNRKRKITSVEEDAELREFQVDGDGNPLSVAKSAEKTDERIRKQAAKRTANSKRNVLERKLQVNFHEYLMLYYVKFFWPDNQNFN